MSEPADFIDGALQYESAWERAEDDRARLGGNLMFYGASVGAIRGTIRDAMLRYPGLGHDDVTALASELWAAPAVSPSAVYERRYAAIVLLQTHVRSLVHTDLTRIEGFLRTAELDILVDTLTTDVIAPLVRGLDEPSAARAATVLARWEREAQPGLARATALLRSAS